MSKRNVHQIQQYTFRDATSKSIATNPSSAASSNASSAEERFVSQSGTAINELFRTQYASLLRFCRVRIRSDADAEDIVQNAFLAARRAYPDKGVEELRPLLFTLVRNMAISHLKLHWNKLRHGGDISEAGAGFACPQSPTPEKQLMDTQSLVIVEEVLAGMSERRREALRLHRYEGLSYEDIARRLSVSSMAVKRHVALAVAEIAQRLAEAEGRDEDPAG